MTTPAQRSDAILAAARRTLADQRAGGRRVPRGKPIGKRSAEIRGRRGIQWLRWVGLFAGILIAVDVAGFLLGVGGIGRLVGLIALVALGFLALRSPRPRVPTRETLAKAPPRQLIGNTQLWLEAQCPQLPQPALTLINQIGTRLDLLADQIDRIGNDAPALTPLRTLVGEHLPQVVSAYTDIPSALRREAHAGSSPDAQLIAALTRIDAEIDSATRQLAEGALDRLAIETRFLDAKYGNGGTGGD